MLGDMLRPRPRAVSVERNGTQAHARIPTTDEELGKRDDDFKPRRRTSSISSYMPWQWRRRRLVLLALLVGLVFYTFFTQYPPDLQRLKEHLPELQQPFDANISLPSIPVSFPAPKPAVETDAEPAQGAAPPVAVGSTGARHYYEGKIKYWNLRESLQNIYHTQGANPSNRNVLFAASSLRSAANLIPMACNMAKLGRNYVHLGLFGRNSLTIKEILEVNGVDATSCPVTFHDARPDYSEYSTDGRAEYSVGGAMEHINEKMHPQAVIVDSKEVEDGFFVKGIQTKTGQLFKTLIEVPNGGYDDFMWLTRLDSSSLANWFTPTIDVVVHAQHDSSGGLKRLLTSLKAADFSGLRHPRLTIELSTTVQPALRHYLDNYRWPPVMFGEPTPRPQNLLTFHHRIPSARMSSEQAALRFVESFYPTTSAHHYMLILSPQAEVSPQFFQYLHYALLEYRYSAWGSSDVAQSVMGIALDVPATELDGVTGFIQPQTKHLRETDANYAEDDLVAFQLQAPSSSAALISGDKWLTFHDFLSKRLKASHLNPATKPAKLISETEPAWMEYLLELMRARGWTIAHPASSFVTIHDDLAQIPEEYSDPDSPRPGAAQTTTTPTSDDNEPFLRAAEPPVLTSRKETDTTRDRAPLHALLPGDGTLLPLHKMPVLSHEGALMVTDDDVQAFRDNFIVNFRVSIGGCSEADARRGRLADPNTADDLFCLPGGDVRFADGYDAT